MKNKYVNMSKRNRLNRYWIAGCLVMVLATLMTNNNLMSQQQQSFSQYHLNDFAFNPATAGTKSYTSFQLAYRRQWDGIEGAPKTMMAYVHTPVEINSSSLGIGLMLYSDQAAAVRRNGMSLSYAQHFGFNDAVSFSLCITGNAEQYGFDREILEKNLDPADPLLAAAGKWKIATDAGFSFLVYGDRWSAGAFGNNLFQSRISIRNNSKSKLYRHYYAMAQVEFELDPDRTFTLLPSIMVKAVYGIPVQTDLNVNFIHLDTKWLGLHVRTNETYIFSVNAGMLLNEKLVIGYAYDFMPNGRAGASRALNNNTHELTLGWRIIKEKNNVLRNVRCPVL